jgi:hypothetical protein
MPLVEAGKLLAIYSMLKRVQLPTVLPVATLLFMNVLLGEQPLTLQTSD